MKTPALLLSLLTVFMVLACNNDDGAGPDSPPANMLSSATEAVDSNGNRYLVGFDQASAINQNPFVEKRNASGTVLWRRSYEESPVDGRAILVAINENDKPWVVFTVDGGSNEPSNITQQDVAAGAFSGAFQTSYGRGGGPVVSMITRLNPDNGEIVRASFLTAQVSSGDTNTLRVTALGFTEGGIALEASAAAWPPGAGTSYSRMPDITDDDRVNGAFLLYYELDAELRAITTAQLRN